MPRAYLDAFSDLSIISMWTVTGLYIKSLYVTWGIFLSLSRVGLPLLWMDILLQIFRCENVMTSWNVLLHIIYSKQCFFSCEKKWLMFITLPSKLARLVYVAGLLIWSYGLFIFWTYHTPHMISVFLCSRILGTLICIWNNGRRYVLYL